MTSKKLIDLLKSIDCEPQRYSGRGMFGEACVGVELENMAEAFTIGATLASDVDNRRDRYDLTTMPVRWDSMGMRFMLYFPNQSWPKDMHEDGGY